MKENLNKRPGIGTFEFQNWSVYQNAVAFTKKAYGLCREIQSSEGKELRDQLRRASQSIVLNIAEGSARWSKADKINFLRIARGSVFECAAILDLVGSILERGDLKLLRNDLTTLGKMLSGFINYLESNKPEKRNP